MSRKVVFEGVTHDFPDDATDDEIRAALNQHSLSVPPPPAAPQSNLSKFGGGAYDATIGSISSLIKHPIDSLMAPATRTKADLQGIVDNIHKGKLLKAAGGGLNAISDMSPLPNPGKGAFDTLIGNTDPQDPYNISKGDPARAGGMALAQGGTTLIGSKIPEVMPEGAKIASAVKGAVSEIKDTPIPHYTDLLPYAFAGEALGVGWHKGLMAGLLKKYGSAALQGAKGGVKDFNLSKLPESPWGDTSWMNAPELPYQYTPEQEAFNAQSANRQIGSPQYSAPAAPAQDPVVSAARNSGASSQPISIEDILRKKYESNPTQGPTEWHPLMDGRQAMIKKLLERLQQGKE